MRRHGVLAVAVAATWVHVLAAPPAGAHAVTGGELPAPPWLLAYAGVAVVALALVGVRALPPRRPDAGSAAQPGAPGERRATPASGPGRWLGLLAYVLVVALAFDGPDSAAGNIAPVAVLVVFWVGLPLLSLALGDVFARINPFDAVVGLLERVLRRDPGAQPAGAGPAWSGAAFLGGFSWFLLAYHRPGSPRAVGVLLLVYAALAIAGGLRWGRPWLRTGEAFGALSATMASLRSAGHRPAPPGMVALVVVWVGGTAFDAVGTTELWFDVAGTSSGWESTAVHTMGLLWVVALVAGAVIAAGRAATRWSGLDPAVVDGALGLAVAALATGWFLTHDITLLLFEGQNFVALLSDPVSRGWDLFGTIGNRIDVDLVEATWVRWAQLVALAAGHAGAVVLAARAARAGGARRAVAVATTTAILAAASVVAAVLLLLERPGA
jgi:hypothetical protein